MTARLAGMLRRDDHQVTNIELFFDLVYVFAVTQLSHNLLTHHTAHGALQTALLLLMVWTAWIYTTWVTNWLDPDRLATRLLLVGLMLAGLVMSAALPHAFGDRGLAVGIAYAVMQIGRSAYTVVALRGEQLLRNYQRILVWCLVSGTFAVIGGLVDGHAREAWWLAAVAVDLLGGILGFRTPGLGRSSTDDWTVAGGHFAERCQAFVLIALGESIVVTGTGFSELEHPSGSDITGFVTAFLGVATLWWLYFDRAAEESTRIIDESHDPGRLARSAYHFLHPFMIGGIIVTAAGDETVLEHAHDTPPGYVRWLILGGTALFLAGHAAFKWVVWRRVPWTRLAGIVALGALALLAPHVATLTLALCTLGVVVAVALSDRLLLTPSRLSIAAANN